MLILGLVLYHPYYWKCNRTGYVSCDSQDYIIPQLRSLRQAVWQAENKLIMVQTRAKRVAKTAAANAANAARISKTSSKKASANCQLPTREPPTREPPRWESLRWEPPTQVVSLEDDVEIQPYDRWCIQELEATIAQYEQEKLRFKKKNKKIQQMIRYYQNQNCLTAEIVTLQSLR